jgi:hypothetical protein
MPVRVGNDFNELDRKAAELAQADTAEAASSEAEPHKDSAATSMSWLAWLWSAIGAGFIALAGLARYLIA